MNDLPVPTHSDTLLAQIERLVRSDIDPSRIQAVMDLYNQERDRQQLEAFNRDQAELQSEIFEVAAKGNNPTFRSAYPKLHDLLKEARPYYTAKGFAVRFGTTLQKTNAPPPREGWIRVVIVVSHNAGHWEENYLDGPPDIQTGGGSRGRTAVQAVGSTVTYLRRYLLMMALNLVPGGDPTDDDGRGGQDTPVTPEQAEEIKKLVSEANMDEAELGRLLASDRLRAKTIDDIPSVEYTSVVSTLKRVKERKAENNGNQ